MIKRLRTKFIRIAMLSVALVLLALSLIVNAANFISTNRDLNQTLDMIYENQGTIPTKRTTDTEEADIQPPDAASAGEEHIPPEEDHTRPNRRKSQTANPRASRTGREGLLTPKRRTPRAIFTCALTRTEILTAAISRTSPP